MAKCIHLFTVTAVMDWRSGSIFLQFNYTVKNGNPFLPITVEDLSYLSPESDCKSSDSLPMKGLWWPLNDLLHFTALYFWEFFAWYEGLSIKLLIYTQLLVQKFSIGYLNKSLYIRHWIHLGHIWPLGGKKELMSDRWHVTNRESWDVAE